MKLRIRWFLSGSKILYFSFSCDVYYDVCMDLVWVSSSIFKCWNQIFINHIQSPFNGQSPTRLRLLHCGFCTHRYNLYPKVFGCAHAQSKWSHTYGVSSILKWNFIGFFRLSLLKQLQFIACFALVCQFIENNYIAFFATILKIHVMASGRCNLINFVDKYLTFVCIESMFAFLSI